MLNTICRQMNIKITLKPSILFVIHDMTVSKPLQRKRVIILKPRPHC